MKIFNKEIEYNEIKKKSSRKNTKKYSISNKMEKVII